MRNRDDRSVAEYRGSQGGLEKRVGFNVYGSRGFIEDENVGGGEEGTG
jgi:hypothetical protein